MGSKKPKKKPPAKPTKPVKNGEPAPFEDTRARRSIMISFKVTPEEHAELLSRAKTKYDGTVRTKSDLYRRELGLPV